MARRTSFLASQLFAAIAIAIAIAVDDGNGGDEARIY